jgi:hypothetical protein
MTERQVAIIARGFYEAYCRLGLNVTQRQKPLPGWHQLNKKQKDLYCASVRSLATDELIEPGSNA